MFGGNPPVPDDPESLAAQARRCRRLARTCEDERSRFSLTQMAEDYEAREKAAREPVNGDAAPPAAR